MPSEHARNQNEAAQQDPAAQHAEQRARELTRGIYGLTTVVYRPSQYPSARRPVTFEPDTDGIREVPVSIVTDDEDLAW